MNKINNNYIINYRISIKNSDSWKKETTKNINNGSFELRT